MAMKWRLSEAQYMYYTSKARYMYIHVSTSHSLYSTFKGLDTIWVTQTHSASLTECYQLTHKKVLMACDFDIPVTKAYYIILGGLTSGLNVFQLSVSLQTVKRDWVSFELCICGVWPGIPVSAWVKGASFNVLFSLHRTCVCCTRNLLCEWSISPSVSQALL